VIATTDVAERLAYADIALWTEWMEALRSIPGNPFGVDIASFDPTEPSAATNLRRIAALHVHSAPTPYFNRVLGVDESTAEVVGAALAYFSERFTPCRFDVNPFYTGPDLLAALNRAGFHPKEFQTNLYMHPIEAALPVVPGVKVRPVRDSEMGFFCDLYERAYYGAEGPAMLSKLRAASIQARAARAEWTFYLATVDGMPAGGAALHLKDGVATLAGGATIYTLRGRGCQRALLQQRLVDAVEAGCDLVVSRCGVGSASQRNMERVGMRTGYTKSIWQQSGMS
jgi:hypothetical protein